MELSDKTMKAQMRRANRLGVDWVVIRGEDELKKGTVLLKNMETGEQEEKRAEELSF